MLAVSEEAFPGKSGTTGLEGTVLEGVVKVVSGDLELAPGMTSQWARKCSPRTEL